VPRLQFLPVAALLILVPGSSLVGTQADFTTRVDLVEMDVCATDRSGRPAQIRPDDLIVFDNGTRQQIALFSPGDHMPLAVSLLVDSSRSMNRGLLDQAAAAATALIDQLPGDSLVEVMAFNDHPAILYPMGTDHRAAALTFSEVAPIGGTSLYESVLVAIRRQQQAERTRNGAYREVIVVLTDGEDTWSRVDFDVVLDEARRSSILLYPVVLPPHDAPDSGTPWQMTELALDTGGKTVAAHHPSDLTNIYQQIAADMRNLYRVGYVPSPLVRDGAWHQVQVRATRDDVVVHTRSGYYASSR
jgi:Ca-activated chloride channel homolog